MKKFIVIAAVCTLIVVGCHPTPAKTSQSPSYKVYKSDGSIVTLTPSLQHPLIFFATWCPHCQKELSGEKNPNAYYIDTFTKESTVQDSFKAVQTFIKTYHTDPDLNRYFVSVAERPQGVPSVPYTLNN